MAKNRPTISIALSLTVINAVKHTCYTVYLSIPQYRNKVSFKLQITQEQHRTTPIWSADVVTCWCHRWSNVTQALFVPNTSYSRLNGGRGRKNSWRATFSYAVSQGRRRLRGKRTFTRGVTFSAILYHRFEEWCDRLPLDVEFYFSLLFMLFPSIDVFWRTYAQLNQFRKIKR